MKKARVRSVRIWEVAFPEGGRALFPTQKEAREYSRYVNSNLLEFSPRYPRFLQGMRGYIPEGG